MRCLVALVLLFAAAPAAAQEPCRQNLGWFDKWVVLPLSGGAGFRDAISTVSALNRVESAREANPIYRALGADPETHAEAFAWLKGGVTTTVLVTAGTLMTSCRPAERWIGRWLAIGHGGVALWAARHNDRVGRPR